MNIGLETKVCEHREGMWPRLNADCVCVT